MSAGLVALLASIGITTWAYTKLQRKAGYGNNQSAYIASAVIFVVCFIVIFTIGHLVLQSS